MSNKRLWLVLGAGSLIVFVAMGTRQRLGLLLSPGARAGLALSATSDVVVLGAVAQVVPATRRSTAFGLITAAGSCGMFAVVPAAQWLLSRWGWRTTF